jgi:uncharacterized RDD family membrane protein YckC
MENSFAEKMSYKTNEELIKIVTIDRSKYQELAIEAANKEIELRNIDEIRLKEVTEKVALEKQKLEAVENNSVSSSIRFVNFLIDFVVIYIFYGLVVPNFEQFLTLTSKAELIIYRIGTLILFFAIYYIPFEYKYQKTLGKIITKTKVVNFEGQKPELGDIVSRTFCRLIPFDRFSFFFTRNGFHDAISKTKVIKDN